MTEQILQTQSDFDYLLTFLPPGWQGKAKEFNALRRCRKIPDAETLLRILLLHLADGCSLRETAARLEKGGITKLSDVAILGRLRGCSEWFRWMCLGLMEKWISGPAPAVFRLGKRIRLVDATRIKEPGPTGSSWCVHYSVELPSLACLEFLVQDKHGCGESFKKFTIYPGDLMIGDRVYASPPGISHVVGNGGDVLVRFPWSQLPLWNPGGGKFDLLGNLRRLSGTRPGDWDVEVKHGDRIVRGRVCAIRKSRQAAEAAKKQLRRAAQKHDTETQVETLETAEYVMVFTTLARDRIGASSVLEIYRGRWQVELVFKRLKSILELGHLRKTDPESTKAWLHGKLLVAFLVEALIRAGESFSPWGYPLQEHPREAAVPVARGVHDVGAVARGHQPGVASPGMR